MKGERPFAATDAQIVDKIVDVLAIFKTLHGEDARMSYNIILAACAPPSVAERDKVGRGW